MAYSNEVKSVLRTLNDMQAKSITLLANGTCVMVSGQSGEVVIIAMSIFDVLVADRLIVLGSKSSLITLTNEGLVAILSTKAELKKRFDDIVDNYRNGATLDSVTHDYADLKIDAFAAQISSIGEHSLVFPVKLLVEEV